MALRTAYITGIFSLIVALLMLLNYRQLVTTDPLETEVMQTMVERLKGDTSNEQLKIEIRNLDLMARNAYFTSQWQIRSGAFLLFGGVIIMVVALRIYYSLKTRISVPESVDTPLDIELLISRKWILISLFILFGGALLAALLSDDHLSKNYALTESTDKKEAIPVQQIVSAGDERTTTPIVAPQEESQTVADEIVNEPLETVAETEQTAELKQDPAPTAKPAEKMEVTEADLQNNFPSFRGAFGLGVAYQKNAPTKWDGASGENVLWKVKVPLHGYNSPIIWGNNVFITGASQSAQSVYCYDLSSGKLIWEHQVSGIPRASAKAIKPTEDTGFAAPTAVADGRFVYAIFATGDIVCVSMQGERIWAKNIGIPDNHYGHSSSLLVWKKRLFVQFDTNVAGKVIALDAGSGDQLWETLRTSKISWASPILAKVGNAYQLVLSSSPEVAGYNTENGEELWKVQCLSGEVGPSPGFYNGLVYAANEYAKLIAIRPGNPPETIWENNEYLPEVASPVAAKGLLFIATSYGVAACFDAANGDLLWEYEANQGFYSSPIIAEDKVYFLDMDGMMHIMSVDKTLKVIGTPELGEQSTSTPAFAPGKILIRGFEHLYCIGN